MVRTRSAHTHTHSHTLNPREANAGLAHITHTVFDGAHTAPTRKRITRSHTYAHHTHTMGRFVATLQHAVFIGKVTYLRIKCHILLDDSFNVC